jgi:hypothetical protein
LGMNNVAVRATLRQDVEGSARSLVVTQRFAEMTSLLFRRRDRSSRHHPDLLPLDERDRRPARCRRSQPDCVPGPLASIGYWTDRFIKKGVSYQAPCKPRIACSAGMSPLLQPGSFSAPAIPTSVGAIPSWSVKGRTVSPNGRIAISPLIRWFLRDKRVVRSWINRASRQSSTASLRWT